MASETPRIEKISVIAPNTLRVKWRGKASPDDVNLTGWIATGGDILAALKRQDTFGNAEVGNHGAAVLWDDGDLAIDASHLLMLATEQKKFGEHDARTWQKQIGLSNNEVADLLDISLSTWNAYKAGGSPIPQSIAIICRAILRDPVIVQAHYRPRKTGRPAA
jgi:hypothetical protein